MRHIDFEKNIAKPGMQNYRNSLRGVVEEDREEYLLHAENSRILYKI